MNYKTVCFITCYVDVSRFVRYSLYQINNKNSSLSDGVKTEQIGRSVALVQAEMCGCSIFVIGPLSILGSAMQLFCMT